MTIFASLIIVLNKVNRIYTIYDLGAHNLMRKNLLDKYKSFGIKELNYEPSNFDSGDPKYVWVRQKHSGFYVNPDNISKILIPFNFSLNKFYGKKFFKITF